MTNLSNEQSYAPWRQSVLTREELRSLSAPNFLLNVRKAASVWAQIICCWGIAGWLHDSAPSLSWLGIMLCACLVGNRYYALYILGHDGLHRRLHPNTRVNDLFNDLFCIGPIGAVTHRNRANHMNHHRHFSTEADPDTYKYACRKSMGFVEFTMSLTALPFVWRAVANVYHGRNKENGTQTASPQSKLANLTWRDLAIIVGWQVLLAFGLTLVFGWWGYPLMWIGPIYVFAFAADMARVYCEHSLQDDAVIDSLPNAKQWEPRSITFMANHFEQALFAPLNMNHHAAHHLWPSIPWHNLPFATELLTKRAQSIVTDEGSLASFHTIRSSYIGWLLNAKI